MAYQYGAPSTGTQRPNCWGDERWHNPNLRECRACYWQTSCRDQILRTRGYQAAPAVAPPPSVAPYYGQPIGPPGGPPQQVPVHIGPARPAPPPAQQPPNGGIYPAPPRYGYGWLSDPMYYTLAASPPPMIPQLDGESFVQRLMKNIGIDMMRSFTWQLHLATRQWVWQPVMNPEPVDVTPVPSQLPGPHGGGQ